MWPSDRGRAGDSDRVACIADRVARALARSERDPLRIAALAKYEATLEGEQ
jgi:hypothetical protein